MRIVVPEDVRIIVEVLNKNGFEAYIVGGCVRDSIMGKKPKDWDITTSARPEEVIPLFSKVIETGIQHGTVTVVFNKENYEITTYRIDGEYNDCRRPEWVYFTDNLEEDLQRRDFTMNAIAYHPKTGCFDPYDGIGDIENKIIRGVGEADLRFKEDALRMMRAIRFASQTGFAIEERTYNAILDNKALIEKVSIERIRDEFLKSLMGDHLTNCLLYNECAIFQYINTELWEYLNKSLENKIEFIQRCCKDITLRLALLFSDMDESAVKRIMVFLKLDNKSIKSVTALVKLINSTIEADRYKLKKLFNEEGTEILKNTLYLKGVLGEETRMHLSLIEDIISKGDPITLKDIDINGEILMADSICSGKRIGETLQYLLDCVHKDKLLNTKDRLINLAKEFNKN